ncbi:MAG: hypothetical protein AB7S38_36380 [Vulcanimicrobiota bacterium]
MLRSKLFLLIAVLLVGMADAYETVSVTPGSVEAENIQMAIDFLLSEPQLAPYGKLAQAHLAAGKYYVKRKERGESVDTETNNSSNDTYVDGDLIPQKKFDPSSCFDDYNIIRLAVTLMHEAIHTQQGKWQRTFSCIYNGLYMGHGAERICWGETLFLLDQVINEHMLRRKKHGATLKAMRKEMAMIDVKLFLLSSYESEHKKNYGNLGLSYISLPYDDKPPVDPSPEDPIPPLVDYLEKERKKLYEQIVDLKERQLQEENPGLESGQTEKSDDPPAPPKEYVFVPPGLQEKDCEIAWTATGEQAGHVLDVTLENKTSQEFDFPFIPGIVLVCDGASRVVVLRSEPVTLIPGATVTASVEGFLLDANPAPSGSSVDYRVGSLSSYGELGQVVARGHVLIPADRLPVSAYRQRVLRAAVLTSLGRYSREQAEKELAVELGPESAARAVETMWSDIHRVLGLRPGQGPRPIEKGTAGMDREGDDGEFLKPLCPPGSQ